MLIENIAEAKKSTLDKQRVMMVARFLRGYEGITSHIATLAKELQRQGWEVALACGMDEAELDNSRGIDWLESQGIKHYQVPFPCFKLSPQNIVDFPRALTKFKKAIAHFQPSLLHAHSLSVCPYTSLIKRANKIPVVSTCHMNPYVKRNSMEVKLSSAVNRYLNRGFLGDRIIAISQEVEESYRTIMHVPQHHIQRIYHGIDVERFHPPTKEQRLKARSDIGITPEAKVVCLIGRLSPFKGHKVLIDAIAKLRTEGISVIALCAGTGDYERDICQYARQRGVEKSLRMLGFADSRQILWSSDAIVLPSQREALPLVICEAMLCGVVPIRTPASGVYDQIDDGVNGFIIDFDDSSALAKRLFQLLTDEKLNDTMSQSAISTAQKKFTVEQMGLKTISLYREARSL